MSNEVLFSVIRSRYQTEVADVVSGFPVQYDNAPFTKPQDSKWVRFTVQPESATQVDTGADTVRYRSFGTALASVFTPINEGDQEALQMADAIADAFRGLNDGSVTFQTPTIFNVGRNGDEWQIDVSCPFFMDNLT